MNTRRNARAEGLAAELHADDGVDPRTAFTRMTSDGQTNARKSLQLCKAAARALRAALACDCGDALLNELEVVAVETDGRAMHLRVTVQLAAATTDMDRGVAAQRLAALTGFLRSAVAAAINRRRAPELRFVVLPTSGGAP